MAVAGSLLLACQTKEEEEEPFDVDFTVTKSGLGFGTVGGGVGSGEVFDCGPSCTTQTRQRPNGVPFQLGAIPEPGSSFGGWSGSGCVAGSTESTVATPIGANDVCDARFDLLPGQTFTLQVMRSGSGAASGTVTSTDGNIQCGAACTFQFAGATVVQLTASTAGNTSFDGWSGPAADCAGTAASIDVAMNADKTCTAQFTAGGTPTRLEFRAAFRWDRGPQEGMTLLGNDDQLVIGGYATVGYLRRVSFANVDAPVGETEVQCSGFIRDVARFARGPVGPLIQASSPDVGGCLTAEPLGGVVQILLNPGRGQAREVPNTDFMAQALFGQGQIHISNLFTGALRVADLSAMRNCVFSLAANDSMVFGVGREGTVGTPTENCNNERRVWAVRVSDGAVLWSLDLGGKPRDVAVSPNGRWLYVANFESNVVHRIDVLNQMQTGTIPVPGGPTGIDVDPSGMYVAVAAFTTSRVHIFQTMGGTEIANEASRGGSR